MNEMPEQPASRWRSWAGAAAPALLLTAGCAAISWAQGGIALGYFATLAFLTVIAPPLILSQSCFEKQAIAAGAMLAAVAVVLLAGVYKSQITAAQWLRLDLLTAAYIALLWGIASIFVRLRFPPLAASAITVALAMAHLGWPIWLSPHLHGPNAGEIVGWLAPVHPWLAANTVLAQQLDAWTQLPLAYRLTTLNQDVPLDMPSSIASATIAWTVVSAILLIVSHARRPRRQETPPPATSPADR